MGVFRSVQLILGLGLLSVACQTPGESPPDDDEQGPRTEGEVVEVATGEAFVGEWEMNESDFRYVDDPSVAIDQNEMTMVVWVDNSQKDVFLQRYHSEGREQLEEAVNVSRSSDIFSWLPRVVVDPEGEEVYVLWEEIVFSGGSHGGEIFFARSEDGGETFEEPVNLSNTINGAGKGRLTRDRWDNGSLDLLRGPQGDLFVAWTEFEGGLRFTRSTDGGQSFSDSYRIAGSDQRPARAPSLATSPQGVIYLVWTVGEDEAADIHFASSENSGESFGPARVATESDGHSDAPKVAVDDNGRVHLVFGESPQGPEVRYQIYYTSMDVEDEAFDPPRPISTVENGSSQAANFPSIAVDEDDNLLVVWEHYSDFQGPPRGLAFVQSFDGGETFREPEVISGTVPDSPAFNGGLQGKLMERVATGPGRAVVVHSIFRPGEGSEILMIRQVTPTEVDRAEAGRAHRAR